MQIAPSLPEKGRKGRLVLVSDQEQGKPAPEAQHVIARLGRRALRPEPDIAEIRRTYAETRRPLLAPLEPVNSIVQVRPGGGVPPLAVIRPHGAESGVPLPALLYLHGGGWTVGDWSIYEPLCRQLANAAGCIVVWAEYRLAPEHPFPAAYDDTRRALAWIRENHGAFGIDRRRIGIAGDSAGGNLAAAACIGERDERGGEVPWVQILLYPCLDMMACMPSHKVFSQGYLLTAELYAWYRRNYSHGQVKLGHWRLSPLFAHAFDGLPPTVVLYAGFDPLRDEAAAYAGRLREARVPVESLYFPDMIHGFLTMGGVIPAAAAGIKRIAAAIQSLTANPFPNAEG